MRAVREQQTCQENNKYPLHQSNHRKMQFEIVTVTEGDVVEALCCPGCHHVGHICRQHGTGRHITGQDRGHDHAVSARTALCKPQSIRHGHHHRDQEHDPSHGGWDKKAEQHGQHHNPADDTHIGGNYGTQEPLSHAPAKTGLLDGTGQHNSAENQPDCRRIETGENHPDRGHS